MYNIYSEIQSFTENEIYVKIFFAMSTHMYKFNV